MGPLGFGTSIFRELALETVLACVVPRPEIEVLGLGFRDIGVAYGELHDVGEMPPGDKPGERRLKELTDAIVDVGTEVDDMYDMDLEVDGTDDIGAP